MLNLHLQTNFTGKSACTSYEPFWSAGTREVSKKQKCQTELSFMQSDNRRAVKLSASLEGNWVSERSGVIYNISIK